ncbi:OLC1v1010383C1 [Oldenlandia corymbosa var. corymbosa]|uniref:OLC1v1010383C1 n=1 Tax=Oldenlandia corymbosa var. corymbosa TaxID=529605 RepID=A0AAV1DRT7_OLDCO|nr:OLC1v1010383C1 [Oldenlandia corymbosa var. corymbosa]
MKMEEMSGNDEQKPEAEKPNQGKEQNRVLGIFSNKIESIDLKPGDHIYTWRYNYLYSHHGIYVGDEKVIHFTRSADHEVGTGTFLDRYLFSSSPSNTSGPPCPTCGDQSRSSGVISSCLECFLSGGELYKFHYGVSPTVFLAKARGGTCTLAASDSAEHAIHRAEFLLQNGFGGYNIFKNNCEDFAIYCKTGLLIFSSVSVGRSGQATSFVAAATAVVSSPLRFMTTSFPGLAAVGCGIYCLSRYVSDIGVRRDVTKIPVERLVAHSVLDESTVGSELFNDIASETCKKE